MVDHASALQMPLSPNKLKMPMGKSLENFKISSFLISIVMMLVIVTVISVLLDLNVFLVVLIMVVSVITISEWYRRNHFGNKDDKVEQITAEYEREIRRDAEGLYEKQLAEYESEKRNVMKARELLWERARVCTRCGTAYLASD